MSPPERVYLHIGLHKTGTTYLQNVMRANRAGIRAQHIEFPGGAGGPSQAFAVWDLQGRRPRGVDDKRISGQWSALVDLVNAAQHPVALLSEERLSLATLKQIRRAVDAFPGSEVNVVVTVRDIGRVAVSAWQEEVKNDKTWTWSEFAAAIKDPAQIATSPARGFWLRQDVVRICEAWESAVPADRITVVTVPHAGMPPDTLLRRFASVIGFDPGLLTEEPAWNNETVGVAATEVIRRMNERLGGRLNQREYDKVVKLTVVQTLARRTDPVRFALPDEELGWATEWADTAIAALQGRGYRVVGDLAELRPQTRPGSRRPDDASDEELVDASLDALAVLTEKSAKAWWMRRGQFAGSAGGGGGLGSRLRGVAFRTQRRAAELADSNPLAEKAVGAVLTARDRARARARGASKG
jgi:hypothetical protein